MFLICNSFHRRFGSKDDDKKLPQNTKIQVEETASKVKDTVKDAASGKYLLIHIIT